VTSVMVSIPIENIKMGPDSAYLELLKISLTASIYEESSWRLIEGPMVHEKGILAVIKRKLVGAINKRGFRIVRIQKYNAGLREQGLDWPLFGLTMVGIQRLNNLQSCIEDILTNNVPGCFVETGVWRGGCSIFAKAVLRQHRADDRIVWCCDSFEGMPSPSTVDLSIDSKSDFADREYLVATEEQVVNNFRKFGLLDSNVRFLKGWFRDTLPTAPISKIAILRMDGDLYDSTMDALNNLYHKISIGGYVIVDDYKSWKGCRQAVDEFRERGKIAERLTDIDAHAVFWKKGSVSGTTA
jgi:O-methyltransferase